MKTKRVRQNPIWNSRHSMPLVAISDRVTQRSRKFGVWRKLIGNAVAIAARVTLIQKKNLSIRRCPRG
jgi:hypothetical protein